MIDTYRISSYSFRGNYSFLDSEIQWSQYIRSKVTVHKCAEDIQGRNLFKGGNYVRKYGIYYEIFKNKLLYSFTVYLQFSLSEAYKKIVVKFRSDCKIRHRELKTINLINNKNSSIYVFGQSMTKFAMV